MPTPHFAARTEILKSLYAALNRNDMPEIFRHLAPDVTRTEFEETPEGGTYRGIEAVKAHFQNGRATWAEGSCTPQEFLDGGDKIVVPVFVKVKLKANQQWVEGNVADVFTFRDDKIIHFHSFFDKAKALRSADL